MTALTVLKFSFASSPLLVPATAECLRLRNPFKRLGDAEFFDSGTAFVLHDTGALTKVALLPGGVGKHGAFQAEL